MNDVKQQLLGSAANNSLSTQLQMPMILGALSIYLKAATLTNQTLHKTKKN